MWVSFRKYKHQLANGTYDIKYHDGFIVKNAHWSRFFMTFSLLDEEMDEYLDYKDPEKVYIKHPDSISKY